MRAMVTFPFKLSCDAGEALFVEEFLDDDDVVVEVYATASCRVLAQNYLILLTCKLIEQAAVCSANTLAS